MKHFRQCFPHTIAQVKRGVLDKNTEKQSVKKETPLLDNIIHRIIFVFQTGFKTSIDFYSIYATWIAV